MWCCIRIMHMQRELHLTLVSSLEGIVDQMVWFQENWHEEVCGVDLGCCLPAEGLSFWNSCGHSLDLPPGCSGTCRTARWSSRCCALPVQPEVLEAEDVKRL